MLIYMKYARRLRLIVFVLGLGLASGWWFERNDLFSTLTGSSHSTILRTNQAIGRGIIDVCLRYGFKPQWIQTKENTQEHQEKKWVKRIWRIQIPGDLPLAVISMAFTKVVVDSGGKILAGKESIKNHQVTLTVGIDSLLCDSIIISRDVNSSHKHGKIALIIDDFGYDITPTVNGFLAFPAKLGISVIPGHPFSTFLAEEAYNKDFEVLIHLPIEPKEPLARKEFVMLKTGMDGKEINSLMDEVEKSIPNAIGLNNHTGSKGTEDTTLMRLLARELLNRKLYFIDSYTSLNSQALAVMQAMKVPSMKRDVFLDHEETQSFINGQLSRLAEIADVKGMAIGIAHATKPLSLTLLSEEIPRLMDLGYQFVFPSELVYSYELVKR